MSVAVITGSAGLVGSEAVRQLASQGIEVIGIDNDMRRFFFGEDASTARVRDRLIREIRSYRHNDTDIRNEAEIGKIFEHYGKSITLVIHAAGQPSHDWAARNPRMDFTVNADGTMVLLDATRRFAPQAVFIFTSTNKVYGDLPNRLPLVELETRWELPEGHPNFEGVREEMSIDRCMHSLLGASKVAADVLVQEYGRYFGMATACFRAGCVAGPDHAGAELHGFLAYLVRCAAQGKPYTVYGYKGKQVRDNIHSADLVRAFLEFFKAPRTGGVYNIGGGRFSNCSMLEAIRLSEELTGAEIQWRYVDANRKGDHIWWISDFSRFREHYPNWSVTYDIRKILEEIYEQNRDRWASG